MHPVSNVGVSAGTHVFYVSVAFVLVMVLLTALVIAPVLVLITVLLY